MDYYNVIRNESYVEVCFYIEHQNIISIGQKMNEINQNAEMNGYNWEAFIKCYLHQKKPELLIGMETDPEAGMYVAYYSLSKENEDKANRLAECIENLVENPEKLYNFLRENGDSIEWD